MQTKMSNRKETDACQKKDILSIYFLKPKAKGTRLLGCSLSVFVGSHSLGRIVIVAICSFSALTGLERAAHVFTRITFSSSVGSVRHRRENGDWKTKAARGTVVPS